MRNSGIRDIENVLGIHRDSVMSVIKAEADKIPVRPLPAKKQKVATAELDEFWSFVGSKATQRWTWYAWDRQKKRILTYQNGRRTDASCKKLCDKLFARYDIKRYNTDDWKSYSKMLPASRHRISKKGTQRIERQNLNFRTHIKRLNRPNDMLLKIRDHARCGDKNLRVPHQFKEATLLGHDPQTHNRS
jgi:IS1 family transposase